MIAAQFDSPFVDYNIHIYIFLFSFQIDFFKIFFRFFVFFVYGLCVFADSMRSDMGYTCITVSNMNYSLQYILY